MTKEGTIYQLGELKAEEVLQIVQAVHLLTILDRPAASDLASVLIKVVDDSIASFPPVDEA